MEAALGASNSRAAGTELEKPCLATPAKSGFVLKGLPTGVDGKEMAVGMLEGIGLAKDITGRRLGTQAQ